MNRIRYRQWIPEVKMPLDNNSVIEAHWHIWGMDDSKDQPYTAPMCDIFDGTYPESFQSTGLHDSKGVEVWEGSIIHITDDGEFFFYADWDEEYELSGNPTRDDVCDKEWFDKAKQGCVFIVKWDKEMAGFWLYRKGKGLEDIDWNVWTGPVTITVIGDTMQNPELIPHPAGLMEVKK